MPYVGPWQEPLTFVEEIWPTTPGRVSGAAEVSGAIAYRPSGFVFEHASSEDVVSGTSTAATSLIGGSMGTCAQGHAYRGTADEALMNTDAGMCKIGSGRHTTAGGGSVPMFDHVASCAANLAEFSYADTWSTVATSYRFAWTSGASADWSSPYTHAPNGFDWPEGAIDVEIEAADVTLNEVWVPAWQGADAQEMFRGSVKEAGASGADWLNLAGGGLWASPADMNDRHSEIPHATGRFDFASSAVAWLQSAWDNGRGGNPVHIDHELQPRIGFAWNGKTPNPDAVATPSNPRMEVSGGLFDLTASVRLRYTGSRWRYIYATPPVPVTVPIRQTSHRDDHLAGGAYQTWPPPKSEQMSNVTFGGYL